MKPQKLMTLCFLIKEETLGEKYVCLAEKKRGFRVGKMNGAGGKVEQGETIEQGARRETKEELGVELLDCNYMGRVLYDDHDVVYDVHVYTSNQWDGEPIETEEMKPSWFLFNEIPYHLMGKSDKLWIPYVLDSVKLNCVFSFSKENGLTRAELIFI